MAHYERFCCFALETRSTCWGYARSAIYADKPTATDRLESNIRKVICEIKSTLLKKVVQNWTEGPS